MTTTPIEIKTNVLRSKRSFRHRTWPLIVLCLALSPAFRSPADELDHWIWRNPLPFRPQINGVVHGGGLWAVFANAGMLATSVDATTWDLANIGTNAFINAGAYGNGRFVAASSRGLFHSYDAHNWFSASNGANLNDIVFGNGLFVGVRNDSTAWQSANGSNWTSQTVGGFTPQFSHLSFANGRYFVLGTASSTPVLYQSADATNWTGPVALGTNAIQKIVYGNGVYLSLNPVVTTTASWSEFRTSTNGTNWSAPNILTNHYVADAVFANGQFVAVDEFSGILMSTDGVTWTEQSVPEVFASGKIAWDGSTYVVTGIFGRIVTSPDALAWTIRTTGPQNSLTSIIHTNGLYVAAGGNFVPGGGDAYSLSTVVTSTNGHDWIARDPNTTNSLAGVACGNGRYVAVGTNGAIVTSTDAMSWNAVFSPTTNLLYAVAYGGGQFVAVGGTTNRATILNSSDGSNWVAQTDGSNYTTLYAIVYAQNQFVAVGQTNGSKLAATLTSPDGLVWMPQTSPATNNLRAVAFGNGVYVAAGDHSALVTSSDAVTWTNLTPNNVISWRGIAYGNGWYVIIGSPPVFYVSTDAANWTLRNVLNIVTLQPSYAITFGDDSFFVTGLEGQILESLPFHPSAPQVTLGLRQTDQPFLSFTGPEAHGYEIQGTDTFPPVWQSLDTVSNLSATTTLPVAPGTNGSRFYRVRLVN